MARILVDATSTGHPISEGVDLRQYTYKYGKTLKAFSLDNSYMRAIMGPFGSGKTSACAIEVFNRACAQAKDPDGIRRSKWAAVRNSYPQLRDTTVPTFLHWLGDLGTYKSSEYDLYLKFNHPEDQGLVEATVCFRALDRPQDIRNLLSVEYTGAFFNEAKEINKNIINAMKGRINRFPPKNTDGTGGATWAGIFMDTNPPDVDSWFYKLFEEEKPARCVKCRAPSGGFVMMHKAGICPICGGTNPTGCPRCRSIKIDPTTLQAPSVCPMCGGTESIPLAVLFKQPSGFSSEAENLPFLDQNYYQNLAAGMQPEFVKVFVHGLYGYIQDGKPVFPNFDTVWHVSKIPLKGIQNIPFILSLDNTGLNQGAVLCQYSPIGQFQVLQEWLFQDMGTRRLITDYIRPYIFSTYPGAQLFITYDPAGVRRSDTDERSSAMEIQDLFNMTPTPARSNALQARISAVDGMLTKRIQQGQPGLLLSSNCRMSIKGMAGEYRYRRVQLVGRDKFLDKPEKNLVSNIMDAIQYGAMFTEDMFDLMQRNRYVPRENYVSAADAWEAFT